MRVPTDSMSLSTHGTVQLFVSATLKSRKYMLSRAEYLAPTGKKKHLVLLELGMLSNQTY